MKVVKLKFILKFESPFISTDNTAVQLFKCYILTTCDSRVPVIQYKATSSLSITKAEQ